MILALLPTAFAANSGSAGYSNSGSTAMAKLTKREIAQLVKMTALSDPTQIYDTAPSISSPYSAGSLRQDILQAGLDRLNALRRIAGLPAVSLDTSYTASAQAASLVNAVNDVMTHYPARPSGMSDTLYQQGAAAARRSNIAYYYGYRPVDGPIASSVDLWMNDSDAYNVDRLGHRRWQLNPAMGKTGFGAVYSSSSSMHSTEYAFDNSGSGVDYDFIAWPSSGNFPTIDRMFNASTAWSVTLNPSKYQTPSKSAVSVTLVRQSDGTSWTFSGNYAASSSGKYFNVETSGYGVSNCIIFRPDVKQYSGVYTVTITGLKTRSGAAATLAYQVDFFDPNDSSSFDTTPNEPETPGATTFIDVPDWCADAASWAAAEDVAKGVGNNRFDPYRTCTHAEILTMLYRAEGSPKPKAAAPFDVESYFQDAVDWAYGEGIINNSFVPGKYCTRADAVKYIWQARGSQPVSSESSFLDVFPDDNYAVAVFWAVELGITNGTGNGSAFNPNMTCSRGEIVTFLHRTYVPEVRLK